MTSFADIIKRDGSIRAAVPPPPVRYVEVKKESIPLDEYVEVEDEVQEIVYTSLKKWMPIMSMTDSVLGRDFLIYEMTKLLASFAIPNESTSFSEEEDEDESDQEEYDEKN
jgi:hypothetical protein